MHYLKRSDWERGERFVTHERLFDERRRFLKLGAAIAVSTSAVLELAAREFPEGMALHYVKDPNPAALEANPYDQISSYNNFYEFTTDKEDVKPLAEGFVTDPWSVTVDGLVERPVTLGRDDLFNAFALEERIYRFRCVEAWSMVVPWVGFELARLIDKVRPLDTAKYVRFETLYDPKRFPDQRRGPFAALEYPYVEGLRMDEAMHPLTLMAVGLYGHTLPPQNGAPLRLVVPWKYGFKSIKSIAKITFTDTEPLNSWQKAAPREYGFYANVNPAVDHPRWSQKRERLLGNFFKQATLPFNGYEKEVASLYEGMDLERYF